MPVRKRNKQLVKREERGKEKAAYSYFCQWTNDLIKFCQAKGRGIPSRVEKALITKVKMDGNRKG